MSRARDLANRTIASAALPKAGGAMTGAITTNSTFDGVDVATRDAIHAPKANPIFTGTVAIPNVANLETAVVANTAKTSYDDVGVRQDITTLALREATNESSGAFNLPGQFIETFTNDDNLGTQTDCDRISGAVQTINISYAGSATKVDYFDSTTYKVYFKGSTGSPFSNETWHNILTDESNNTKFVDAVTAATSNSGYPATYDDGSLGVNFYFIVDYLTSKRFSTNLQIGKNNGWGDVASVKIEYSTNNSSYTDLNLTNVTSSTTIGTGNSGGGVASNFASDGTFDWSALTGSYGSSYVTLTGFSDFDARYIKLTPLSRHSTTNNNSGFGTLTPFEKLVASGGMDNAAGTLIQDTNTVASSKTKVAGVMLYKDNGSAASTFGNGNALEILFSCNGSDYTTVSSYTTVTPEFSSGIKMVKLGETTMGSGEGGTDVRYKAVWANQVSGSLETQLHGIGLNY